MLLILPAPQIEMNMLLEITFIYRVLKLSFSNLKWGRKIHKVGNLINHLVLFMSNYLKTLNVFSLKKERERRDKRKKMYLFGKEEKKNVNKD